MSYFSERADALLRQWLSSPTWHRDKPSSNALFYRFAAALMREIGYPDIREVQGTLEEAGRALATDYDERGGDTRVAALCQYLQVLYDFFQVIQEDGPIPVSSTPQTLPSVPPRTTTESMPLPKASSGPLITEPINLAPTRLEQPRETTSPGQPVMSDPTSTIRSGTETSPDLSRYRTPPKEVQTPKKSGRRRREVRVEQSEANAAGPSEERIEAYWREVIRLYGVLIIRSGMSPLPPLPVNDHETLVAEMQRYADTVMQAEEITDAEKTHLIGILIDQVLALEKDEDAVTVEIKWAT